MAGERNDACGRRAHEGRRDTAAEAMKARTTDDFHQSLETGDLRAFVCVLIAVRSVTNYNKLMRPNSGFSLIFKHSISQAARTDTSRRRSDRSILDRR